VAKSLHGNRVDRIVLNAFFRMGHAPGGFRVWWQALTGSEETLDNAHLMRLAGRFSRRIHGYAKANGIPVVHCSAGERKHELAEETVPRQIVSCERGQFNSVENDPFCQGNSWTKYLSGRKRSTPEQ
jgi:hypothetical protein